MEQGIRNCPVGGFTVCSVLHDTLRGMRLVQCVLRV
jgi:hypothetical protein